MAQLVRAPPEDMVQYSHPYNYGNSPAQFTMYIGGSSGGTLANPVNGTFAWKRLKLEVTLGNPTDKAITYSRFKVSCGGRTEYIASVTNLSSTVNKYPQQCGDGNNPDLGASFGSVSISAISNINVILDLGYILDSNYTLNGENFTAAALSNSNMRNPYVTTQPGSGSNGQQTITITAEKSTGVAGVTETVTLGKFTVNLKYA